VITNQEKKNFKLLISKFFQYYTYNNIYFRENNNYPEFCDALVVFEDYNLIFQMKTRVSNISHWNEGYVEGLLQLEKNFITMQNPNIDIRIGQGKKAPKLDIQLGKKTFYILLMDGMSELYNNDVKNITYEKMNLDNYHYFFFNTIPDDQIKHLKKSDNLFIYSSQETFEKTLKYCSTIKDYINFLEFTKDFIYNTKGEVLIPHDECLLYLFLTNSRSLANDCDFLIIDDSCNLSDTLIKELLEKENESYQTIDRDLIEFSINQSFDKDSIRNLAKLNRRDRVLLTKAIYANKTAIVSLKENVFLGNNSGIACNIFSPMSFFITNNKMKTSFGREHILRDLNVKGDKLLKSTKFITAIIFQNHSSAKILSELYTFSRVKNRDYFS
jgi:hypothetical protein